MGSIVDQDARVGHKSKTEHFFDIKQNNHNNRRSNHYSSKVNNGAYVDGTNFDGDKAYFKKPILDKILVLEAKAYIPIGVMAYRIDEERFSYNKDSDEWFW